MEFWSQIGLTLRSIRLENALRMHHSKIREPIGFDGPWPRPLSFVFFLIMSFGPKLLTSLQYIFLDVFKSSHALTTFSTTACTQNS